MGVWIPLQYIYKRKLRMSSECPIPEKKSSSCPRVKKESSLRSTHFWNQYLLSWEYGWYLVILWCLLSNTFLICLSKWLLSNQPILLLFFIVKNFFRMLTWGFFVASRFVQFIPLLWSIMLDLLLSKSPQCQLPQLMWHSRHSWIESTCFSTLEIKLYYWIVCH